MPILELQRLSQRSGLVVLWEYLTSSAVVVSLTKSKFRCFNIQFTFLCSASQSEITEELSLLREISEHQCFLKCLVSRKDGWDFGRSFVDIFSSSFIF